MRRCPECPREFASATSFLNHYCEEHVNPAWAAIRAREIANNKLTIPALGELQCLCRTQHHCEKHCTVPGDHV